MGKKNNKQRQELSYVDTWLRSLRVPNVREPWHLDVIESQFVRGEERRILEDQDAARLGRPVSGVSEADRRRIIARAREILAEHGRNV